MIRKITKKDHQNVIGIINQNIKYFWQEIKGDELIGKIDPPSYLNYLIKNFQDDKLVGWIYEENKEIKGMCLFYITYEIFTNIYILKELFWYMKPESRKSITSYRLVKKAEEFAKENDIQYVSMMHMAYPNPEKLKDFYIKMGYHMVQTEYFKKIA